MLAEETWEALLQRDPYTAANAGRRVRGLGCGDLAEGVADAARERRERLDRIDLAGLDCTGTVTAAYLRHWLHMRCAGVSKPRRSSERAEADYGVATVLDDDGRLVADSCATSRARTSHALPS